MRPLSYELIKADLVHWIDHRFNAVWKNIKCLHYPFLTFRHKSSFVLGVQKKLSLYRSAFTIVSALRGIAQLRLFRTITFCISQALFTRSGSSTHHPAVAALEILSE